MKLYCTSLQPTHAGCVNALDWSSDGSLLASSGDDKNAIIYKFSDIYPDFEQNLLGSKLESSVLSEKSKLIKFPTSHRSNVFQIKFLPSNYSNRELITAANDGQIILQDIVNKASRPLLGINDRMNNGGIHRLAMSKYDNIILAACEGQTVLQVDPRMSTPIGQVGGRKYSIPGRPWPGRSVNNIYRREPVARINPDWWEYCRLGRPNLPATRFRLYAIDRNPTKPYLFSVGGSGSDKVAEYDLRYLKIYSENLPYIKPVKYYSPKNDTCTETPNLWKSVTAVMYSKNGETLLANNTPGKVRLYDVNSGNSKNAHTGNPIKNYYGHRNIMTVKGVSFYGPNDDYILSGSDDGRMYFWDKYTSKLINTGVADNGMDLGTSSEGVVNCITPHPKLPFIATSGLDSDVKLWSVTSRPADTESYKELLMRENRKEIDKDYNEAMDDDRVVGRISNLTEMMEMGLFDMGSTSSSDHEQGADHETDIDAGSPATTQTDNPEPTPQTEEENYEQFRNLLAHQNRVQRIRSEILLNGSSEEENSDAYAEMLYRMANRSRSEPINEPRPPGEEGSE